jgi:hypothetical protein
MKKNKKTLKRKRSIESKYWDIVKIPRHFLFEEGTLQQPHINKFIDSVTTYGAYEEPI